MTSDQALKQMSEKFPEHVKQIESQSQSMNKLQRLTTWQMIKACSEAGTFFVIGNDHFS